MNLLLDSNIIIYLLTPQRHLVERVISAQTAYVSWISYPEVLGFPNLTEADRLFFDGVFQSVPPLPVTELILREAANLRRQKKLTLGDAIIAATALVHGLTLVTANTRDFKKFPQLPLFDPFEG